MRRREFITLLLGGAAVARPLPGRAQQTEPVRRIGVLMTLSANSSQGQARVAAFRQALQQLGWIDSSNVRIDIRWGEGDADRIRNHAAELAALGPNVIVANGSAGAASLLLERRRCCRRHVPCRSSHPRELPHAQPSAWLL